MFTDHQRDILEAAVRYAFAEAQMAATASYLERGRQHRDLSDTRLEDKWIETFRIWSMNSCADACRANDDLTVELELRRKEIPLSRVQDEFDILLARAQAIATKDGAAARIGGQIVDVYLEAIDELQ